MEIRNLPYPKKFSIQLHITNKCNLRCKHCSQASGEKIGGELNTQELLNILNDYLSLLRLWRVKGHISISGGEPFTREDVFSLLKKINENKHFCSYSILTNGLLITEKIAKELRKLQPKYVQVSLEGMEKTNDKIRGDGTFKKIIKSIQILLNENIRTLISFTAHKDNHKEFSEIVDLGKQLGVYKVWTERLCPCGRALDMKNIMLEPLELKEFYHSNCEIANRLLKEKSKTSVQTSRSLCYLVDQKKEYICYAGTLLVIMPNGDVLPCTRVPIVVGNLTKQTLFEIWYSNNLLWKLRDKNEMDNTCKKCQYFDHCGGGARCISYAYFGTPFAPDPQCWIAFKKLPPQARPSQTGSNGGVKLNKMIPIPKTDYQDTKPYLKEETNGLYYATKYKEHKLTKTEDENGLRHNPYIHADLSKIDLNQLMVKILDKDLKLVLLCFETEYKKLNRAETNKIINFLNKLEEKGIEVKITKPLPRCSFNFNYEKFIKKFKAPKNCFECLELFRIKDGNIQLCSKVNKKGPELKYMNNRHQIYEYFNYFHDKLIPKEPCSKCIHYLRKNCRSMCFYNK